MFFLHVHRFDSLFSENSQFLIASGDIRFREVDATVNVWILILLSTTGVNTIGANAAREHLTQ